MIEMMISFVIPAHNEEAVLGATLDALLTAARALKREFEVIVVDDASTDRTAEIAHQRAVRVVNLSLRQISAVRNAGAKAARGDLLIFIDADTLVSEPTLRAALAAIESGAIGGGARVKLEPNAPRWAKNFTALIVILFFRLRWAAGCFVFARRDVFERVGGFDQEYFLGEELFISRALKRHGKFVIVPEPVVTSARKFRTYTPRDLLGALISLLRGGPKSWKSREAAPWWYEARRETNARQTPSSRPTSG
jgi:glycosyltransferase involved in cell wall biosynthesis